MEKVVDVEERFGDLNDIQADEREREATGDEQMEGK